MLKITMQEDLYTHVVSVGKHSPQKVLYYIIEVHVQEMWMKVINECVANWKFKKFNTFVSSFLVETRPISMVSKPFVFEVFVVK